MTALHPEEIHALIANAFNAGDRTALTELYEPNAGLIVPPEGQRVNGRDAIAAAVEPTFSLGPRARVEFVEKLEVGGLALTHARWSIAGIGSDGPVEMSGRGTVVSRRQLDGSWRIVLDNPMSPA